MTASLAIFLFIAQFLAFVIKGLVGFGNPLISNPLMAMRLDNQVITPGNLLLDLPVNVYMTVRDRKSFDAKVALPVAAFIMLGVIPGTLFLKMSTPWVIKALLGVFIIGLGAEMLTRKQAKVMKPSVLVRSVVSFASGIMAGLFGINMLFLAYMERVSDNRDAFRSNVCFVFALENAFRALVYLVSGMFSFFTLQITLISVPAAALGLFVGGRIDKKISEKTAKRLVISVFILGGVSILVKALLFRV